MIASNTLGKRLRNAQIRWQYIASFFKALIDTSQTQYLNQWLGSHRFGYLLDRQLPWITYDAYNHLRKHVPVGSRVFEYGSGGSTLFWINELQAECVSIEHDAKWYELVKGYLTDNENIDYRLITPEKNSKTDGDPYHPDYYLDDKYLDLIFKSYVQAIDAFPDGTFDVVLVDGRSRPSCIQNAHPKVKLGGFLVVDNSDRKDYFTHLEHVLSNYEAHVFRGLCPSSPVIAQTTVFQRKK